MTILFNRRISGNETYRVKAPLGYIFVVKSIYYSMGTESGEVGEVNIYNRDVEDGEPVTTNESPLSGLRADAISVAVNHILEARTKYLSMVVNLTGSAICYLIISGDIVKAPEDELVWEWVANNR
jgi:hypothetical protein